MVWFKVDDTMSSHPKARRAGTAAIGLWTVAGAYASQYLTDGFVPEWYVLTWPDGADLANKLVRSDLWIEGLNDKGETGWWFHQWEERNPSKEKVEADREATKARQQKYRDKQASAQVSNASRNGVTNGVSDVRPDGVTNGAPTRPDPTRPSSPSEKSPKTLRLADANPGSDRFEEFWAVYPKRGEHSNPKKTAKARWDVATRTADPDVVIAAAGVYAAKRQGKDPQHTAQAATWLNQERWADEYGEPELESDPNAWMQGGRTR